MKGGIIAKEEKYDEMERKLEAAQAKIIGYRHYDEKQRDPKGKCTIT